MRSLAYFILPFLVFAGGLAAGSWFSIRSRAADFSAGVERRLAQPAPGTFPGVAGTGQAFSSDEEMLTEIMSAMTEEEPLLRKHRLHDLLGRLDSVRCDTLFGRALKMDDHSRREELLAVLLKRWSVIDPAKAASAVRPYFDRLQTTDGMNLRSLERAVSTAWAKAMPEAALAAVMAAPDSRWSSYIARTAFEALDKADPGQPLELLSRMPASRLRAQLCENAITALADKDSAAAEACLYLLPDTRQRARIQSQILGKLAGNDPAAGLARLALLAPNLTAGRDGVQMVAEVLRAAGKKDPAAALAAIEGVPEQLQNQALNAALVGWAGEHPVDALEWAAASGVDLAEVRSPLSPGSISLFESAFGRDFAKTLAWTRSQPVSPGRDAMLSYALVRASPEQSLTVYAELTPAGQTGAAGLMALIRGEAWARELPPGAARSAAVQELASRQANTSERMAAYIDSWPAGADRDAALSGLATNLASNSPDEALDFVRRVNDAASRENIFEKIARNWLSHDAPAAPAWIASTQELSAEQKRVILRQFDQL